MHFSHSVSLFVLLSCIFIFKIMNHLCFTNHFHSLHLSNEGHPPLKEIPNEKITDVSFTLCAVLTKGCLTKLVTRKTISCIIDQTPSLQDETFSYDSVTFCHYLLHKHLDIGLEQQKKFHGMRRLVIKYNNLYSNCWNLI